MHRTLAPLIRRAARLSTCALCVLSLASSGCSATSSPPDNGAEPETETETEEEEELEEALSLSVDAIDVRHGSLRIEATMLDGSADVSMWLGPTCEAREVGRGIATRSGFAWSLSGDDVARAMACNLVVRARTRNDEGLRVRRVAPLDVAMELVPDGGDNGEGGDYVVIVGQASEGETTALTFASPARATRLHIGGSVIGADEPEEDEEEKRGDGSFAVTFTVGNDDLARSMLHRRHVSVLGEHFLAAIRVGPITLEVAEPEEEVALEVRGED